MVSLPISSCSARPMRSATTSMCVSTLSMDRFPKEPKSGSTSSAWPFFLIPACLFLAFLCWPYFLVAFQQGEVSSNAGGLDRWPVKLMLFAGFALLVLQGISELIKRIAALNGVIQLDTKYEKPLQ